MRTIEKILKENSATIEGLRTNSNCNGCGGKGGIDFGKIMQALPYFRQDKGEQLMKDLRLVCCLHDLCFARGGNIINFIKCNWKLAINVYRLLNWTTIFRRFMVASSVFLATTFFGGKYFNWIKKK